MDLPSVIRKKRDGIELTEDEIEFFISKVKNGDLQDCQTGAMLMAMFINGLTTKETAILTKAMVFSGEVLDWPLQWSELMVDKHSTGGIGDKISIVLAPSLAACGLKVPMISGRSLGITGGTLDKVESIPGFRVSLSKEELNHCIKNAGCFIASTTSCICPADKELYKKRDATCTIDNYNLITGSIISKKVSEGAKFLVVDLKVGKGTFMKDVESARKLGNLMITVSKTLGMKTIVVLTRMDCPLGRNSGNSLEVLECIDSMKGEKVPHINELVQVLGGALLKAAGKAKDLEEGKRMIDSTLKNGQALDHFKKMLSCQGVKNEVIDNICSVTDPEFLPLADCRTELLSTESGWVKEIDAEKIGRVCLNLGAVNVDSNKKIDHGVGVRILRTIGEEIHIGEPWIIVYHSFPLRNEDRCLLEASIKVATSKFVPEDLVIEFIG